MGEKQNISLKKLNYSEKFDLLFNDFMLLKKDLMIDLNEIEKLKKMSNKSTWKRLYVRTVFSIIDAEISFLKAQIILTGEIDHLGLSEKEESILYGKDKKLKVKRLNFLDDVIFTFELFSDINYAFLKFNRNSKEWNYFASSLKIRNRVTHPKNYKEILISDKELIVCKKSFYFFENSLINLLTKCENALNNTFKNLESHYGKKN